MQSLPQFSDGFVFCSQKKKEGRQSCLHARSGLPMSGGGRLVEQGGLRAEGAASGPVCRPCGIPCRAGRAAHCRRRAGNCAGLCGAFLQRDGVHSSSMAPFRAKARSNQLAHLFGCGGTRTRIHGGELNPIADAIARNRPHGIRFGTSSRTAAASAARLIGLWDYPTSPGPENHGKKDANSSRRSC